MTTRNELATRGPDAIDRAQAAAVTVSNVAGGVSFASALEVMEFAKLMAVSMQAVPKDFRNNPGLCLAVTFQAVEWRMSPFQVANKAYVVNDRLGFESQLIHAVIEARAPLKGRLRCEYLGEGADMQCRVFATFNGEDSPHEYTSPKFSAIPTKNSPLWKSDPQQQLFYYASRSWARKWAPDVLLGIYSREEVEEMEPATPAGSGLHARLAGAERQAEGHLEGRASSELDQIASNGVAAKALENTAQPEPQPLQQAQPEPTATQAQPEPEHRTGEAEPAGRGHLMAEGSTVKPGGDENDARDIEQRVEQQADMRQPPGDAKAEKPKAEKAKPKAAAKEAEADPLAAITTPEQYQAHALAWLAAATDIELLHAQWNRERSKRAELGIVEDLLIALNTAKGDRLKTLKAAA